MIYELIKSRIYSTPTERALNPGPILRQERENVVKKMKKTNSKTTNQKDNKPQRQQTKKTITTKATNPKGRKT